MINAKIGLLYNTEMLPQSVSERLCCTIERSGGSMSVGDGHIEVAVGQSVCTVEVRAAANDQCILGKEEYSCQ